MAVRVLSIEPPPEVIQRITCKHCGARLEYVPNDIQVYHGRDYGGGPDGQEWVDCPNCKKKAIIRAW